MHEDYKNILLDEEQMRMITKLTNEKDENH